MELQIEGVSKRFKDKAAVSDVSLTVTPGVWGLLGANGAGKTTLMRMIAGIMRPTAGEIRWDGVPIGVLGARYRDVLGYLPQEFGFYPEFTVEGYLAYMAALKGLPNAAARRRIDELLELVTLTQVRRKRIVRLSGGMKRRVGIAQALLNEPEILILDEPTSGLDPEERVRFRNLLSAFAQERIVLISTHIVPDVEYIATRNAVMKDGRLLASGTTQALIRQAEGKVWRCERTQEALAEAKRTWQIVNLRAAAEGRTAVRYLSARPHTADSVPEEPRLEDAYLWLSSQRAQEGGQGR